MKQRVIDGIWNPGMALPSEFQLAEEFGVSQGTVRKALDALAAENIVVRRQGRGTFVAEHDPQRALFHFFHLVGRDGTRPVPESELLSSRLGKASRSEAAALDIAAGDAVVRMRRLRTLDGEPAIHETLILAAAPFPDILSRPEIPNELYSYYQSEYGVTVARAEERLSAVAASADDARVLGVDEGAPLLQIERRALALDGRPVEWRVSRCNTRDVCYLSELV